MKLACAVLPGQTPATLAKHNHCIVILLGSQQALPWFVACNRICLVIQHSDLTRSYLLHIMHRRMVCKLLHCQQQSPSFLFTVFTPTLSCWQTAHVQVMISLPDQFDAQNKLCMPELPNLPAYSTDRQLFVVQPGVADYRVVLDAEGNNAGFATYVEKLFAMAEELGVKASFSTHINSIEQAEKGFVLKTATNTVCTSHSSAVSYSDICPESTVVERELVAVV